MPADHLPATPALRRLAFGFLSLSPFGFGEWRIHRECAECGGVARGYRDESGALVPSRLPMLGLTWWSCAACGGHGYTVTDAIPLHVPAGMAVARLRVAEISDTGGFFVPDAEVGDWLRANDPEIKEVSDGR